MYHTYAKAILTRTVLDEIPEPRFRFRQCHAMQVDFGLHAVSASTEFAHRAPTHVLPMKTQCTTRFVFQRVDIVFKTFQKYRVFVRASEPGFWFRPGFDGWHAPVCLQRFRVGHRFLKDFIVVISHSRLFEAMVCAKH
jgi:hypothetical protein